MIELLAFFAVISIPVILQGIVASASERSHMDQQARDALPRWNAMPLAAVEVLPDPEALVSKVVRPLFDDLVSCRERDDYRRLRPSVSDGLYEGLRLESRLLALQGLRRYVGSGRMISGDVERTRDGAVHDMVHVRVISEWRQVELDLATTELDAEQVAAAARMTRHDEIWTFARSAAARKKPVREGAAICPGCGKALPLIPGNVCPACGVILNAGASWVLTKITEAYAFEWPLPVKGLKSLRARDPHVSAEVLRCRALLLFWRWVEAKATGTTGPLAKVARPEFLERMAATQALLASQGRKEQVQRCQVDAITVQRVETLSGMERLSIDVHWTGAIEDQEVGEPQRTLPIQQHISSFALLRAEGTRTSAHHGLASNRCPHCHAPLGDAPVPECERCGETILPGVTGWAF